MKNFSFNQVKMNETIKISGFVQGKVCNFNDGILFTVHSDLEYTCYYESKYPISSNDMVIAEGEFESMIICGEEKQIFYCYSLTARCKSDLTIFLANYFKTNSNEDINNLTMRFMELANFYDESVSDVICKLAENCAKYYDKYANEILTCAKIIFPACDDEKALEIMKKFLLTWYSECLIRPLELLGIPKEIVQTFKISLGDAIEICQTNPFRIPQIPYEIAERIFYLHLREEPTKIQQTCGKINRMVLSKLADSLWTSVPISFAKNKYQNIDVYIDLLISEYFIKVDCDALYLSYILKMENCVADKIYSLCKLNKKPEVSLYYPSNYPSEEQEQAVKGALKEQICFVDGGPGTGKTTITSHIIRNASRQGMNPLALAFTGKAVTRLRQIAIENQIVEMCEIMTIDMAIVTQDLKFDIVIIDEISMVTTELFYRFIQKYHLKNTWSLILIGDVNQLPPISWGSFMKQLLVTGIPRFSLTKNYRSEKTILEICNSLISKERLTNQEHVNWKLSGSDYRFHIGGIERVKDILLYFRNSFIQEMKKEEDTEDYYITKRKSITIVTPFRNVSVTLNSLFQEIFMYGKFITLDYRKWYKGDRVILLKNNYMIDVMNGEEGEVVEIYDDHIIVMFRNDPGTLCPFVTRLTYNKLKKIKKEINAVKAGNTSCYDDSDILLYDKLIASFPLFEGNLETNKDFFILDDSNLAHAYALTVHKSQGSQYVNTIVYIPDRNINFVNVNLIYTAVSRAQIHLDIITENIETLNSCSLRTCSWTSENLALKINMLCSQLENYNKHQIENVTEFQEDYDANDDDFNAEDFM